MENQKRKNVANSKLIWRVILAFSHIFTFQYCFLENQDQQSNYTWKCLHFEYCYSENHVQPSYETREVQTCELAKMTLRVRILSHVWLSKYCYPENTAYPSNNTRVTLIFWVLLLRKYLPTFNLNYLNPRMLRFICTYIAF